MLCKARDIHPAGESLIEHNTLLMRVLFHPSYFLFPILESNVFPSTVTAPITVRRRSFPDSKCQP